MATKKLPPEFFQYPPDSLKSRRKSRVPPQPISAGSFILICANPDFSGIYTPSARRDRTLFRADHLDGHSVE